MTRLPTGSVHARLLVDHDLLDLLLDHVLAAYRCGDRDAATSAFCELEARLVPHLETEERMLFPDFARVEPGETAALHAEHDAIRARLAELGIEVDLHQMRVSAIEELARMLRRHASRENALLYRWAERVFAKPERSRDEPDFLRPPPELPP